MFSFLFCEFRKLLSCSPNFFNVPELFCRLRKMGGQLSNFSKTDEINVSFSFFCEFRKLFSCSPHFFKIPENVLWIAKNGRATEQLFENK